MLLFFGALVCGAISAAIQQQKGADAFNVMLRFALGALLGPIGALIAFKACPFCRSTIHPTGVRCPECLPI